MADDESNSDDKNDGFIESSELSKLTGSRLTPLVLDAIQMHEYFCAFIEAGFTESQALRLVGFVFSEGETTTTITMSFDDDDDDEDLSED